MVRTYGSDALVKLIRSYADGRTDDEAFTAALGVDIGRVRRRPGSRTCNAKAPTKYGPQPRGRPARCPAAWTGGSAASGGAGGARGRGGRFRRARRPAASGAANRARARRPAPDRTGAGLGRSSLVVVGVVVAIVGVASWPHRVAGGDVRRRRLR